MLKNKIFIIINLNLILPAATPAAAPADTKSRLCLSVRKCLKI
jgi:hypothetical protein